MLDLRFIRHAQSRANVDRHIVSGQSNETPLTPLGLEQGEKLGKFLKKQKVEFDKIFVSPAFRTVRTKDQAFNFLGADLEKITSYHPEMLELDQGDFTGIHRDKVYIPKIVAKINEDNWNFRPPNGESQRDVEERALKFLHEEILPRDIDGETQTFGLFSHGLWIKCMLRGILDFDPKVTRFIETENTSITRLQYRQGKDSWKIIGINQHPHLYE